MTLEEQKKLLEGKKKVRKDKITLDEFFSTKNKLAINCKTQQQAKILLKIFRKLGQTWWTGVKYDLNENFWDKYGENTCYSNGGKYGRAQAFENVINFEEVDFGKHLEECRMIESKKKRKEGTEITIEEFFSTDEEIAIHCETKNQAKALFSVFKKLGKKWYNGKEYDSKKLYWIKYAKNTCYSNEGFFGSPREYEKVIDFDEVDFGKLLSQNELIC